MTLYLKYFTDWAPSLNSDCTLLLSVWHNTVCLLCCRLRKVWQKRKCTAKNGYLTISHGTVRNINTLFWLSLEQISISVSFNLSLHSVLVVDPLHCCFEYMSSEQQRPKSQVKILLTSLPQLSLTRSHIKIFLLSPTLFVSHGAAYQMFHLSAAAVRYA